MIRGILRQTDKYCLRTWFPQRYGSQTGTYLDLGGTTETSIRPAAAAAFALAVSLTTGAYEPAVTGVSASDARATCARLARSLAYRHRRNAVGGWGWQWQTNLWAALAAQAAWLVADDLTEVQRMLVAGMITDEANWRLSQPIIYWKDRSGQELTPGDSKAEEASWNAMLLQAAVVALPNHPHRGAWLLNCRKLMISAFSRQADLTSNQVVDGINISAFLQGWNINGDGTLVNHNRIHPDYMCTNAHNLQAVCLFALAGHAPPQSALHNQALVYSALTSKAFAAPPYAAPGGTIYRTNSPALYYPQGNDWGSGRRMHAATADVMIGAFGLASGPTPGPCSTAARWPGCRRGARPARRTPRRRRTPTPGGSNGWRCTPRGPGWRSGWCRPASTYRADGPESRRVIGGSRFDGATPSASPGRADFTRVSSSNP